MNALAYNVGARPLNDTIILASLISTPERRGSNVRSPTRRIRHLNRLGHSHVVVCGLARRGGDSLEPYRLPAGVRPDSSV